MKKAIFTLEAQPKNIYVKEWLNIEKIIKDGRMVLMLENICQLFYLISIDWMHGSARWAGYPSDSSRRLMAAGVARIFSDATVQGLRLRRRRRLSPPAPSAGRTSGRPGATWPAPMRPADIRRPGPKCACSRLSVIALASGGSLRVRRHVAGRSFRASHRTGVIVKLHILEFFLNALWCEIKSSKIKNLFYIMYILVLLILNQWMDL